MITAKADTNKTGVSEITGTEPQEYYGLSTDTKPLIAQNGAAFLEMDTGDIYLYDAENAQWINFSGSSGEANVGSPFDDNPGASTK